MSAVAGSVPQQGVSIEKLQERSKKGPRGNLGHGTPGLRLRHLWESDPGQPLSLKGFVRLVLKQTKTQAPALFQPAWTDGPTAVDDAREWLDSKRPGGGAKARAAQKVRRARIADARAAAAAERASKAPKKKGGGRGDRTDDRR